MNNFHLINNKMNETFLEFKLHFKTLNFYKKIFYIYFLLGPIIYLIERDPADLWLSSVVIIFLVRSFKTNDWKWIKTKWFKFAFYFWIFALISSLISEKPVYSFSQGFVWFRFPIFAIACQTWILKDEHVRKIFLYMIGLAFILMCIILSLELILEPLNSYNLPKDRLSWPYGDLVPGSFLAKSCLPFFITCLYFLYSSKNKLSFCVFFILISLHLTFTYLTGERINFIILFSTLTLFTLLITKDLKRILLIFSLFLIVIIITSITNPKTLNRYTDNFLNRIPIINYSEKNTYWGAWRTGIHQGIKNPFFGVGPSGTRYMCKKLENEPVKWLPGKNFCGNHPHNFYLQLFGETGLFGLILGTLMILNIIKESIVSNNIYKINNLSHCYFLIPIALFFPISQHGSFFGQWGNLFIWIAIAYALANNQNLSQK